MDKNLSMYKLSFFIKTDKGICGSDFERPECIELINTNFILSISDLKSFELPFSGTFKGRYALITMSNNDQYYIKEISYKNIISFLPNPVNL